MECIALVRQKSMQSLCRTWSRQHALFYSFTTRLPVAQHTQSYQSTPSRASIHTVSCQRDSGSHSLTRPKLSSSPKNGIHCNLVPARKSSTRPTPIVTESNSSTTDSIILGGASASSQASSTQETVSQALENKRLKLPYHVSRSATNNLPIYTEFKGHRTLRLTLVRKITGDATRLKNELIKYLEVKPKDAAVVQPANYIRIKGRHSDKIQKYLLERGF